MLTKPLTAVYFVNSDRGIEMRIVAALISVLLLLPGCSQNQPQPKEPKASVSTTTPSRTAPTVPPMPAEAQADSEAGAIAFVKHYIDVFNYASNTGDVKELQRLSDPTCEGCTEYLRFISDTYVRGMQFSNVAWTPSVEHSETLNDTTRVWQSVAAVEHGKPVTYDLYFEVDNHPTRTISVLESDVR